MVTDRLFINGVALDMGNDTIRLTYENNYFGEVDTLKLSYSYSFTLPRTLVNDGVFMQGYAPATGCNALRKYYSCEYERNGGVVVRGSLCVNEVSERGYICSLVWGLDALKAMGNEKQKLWQLPAGTSHQNDTIQLTYAPTYGTTDDFLRGANFGYARYYSGITPQVAEMAQKPTVLPCVNVRYILNLIRERYNITLNIPNDREEIVNKMVVALTSARAWREGMPTPRGSFVMAKQYSEQFGWEYQYFIQDNANGVIYQKYDSATRKYLFTVSQNATLNNVKIELTCNVQFSVQSEIFGYYLAEYSTARGFWVVTIEKTGVAVNEGADFDLAIEKYATADPYPHEWLTNLELICYNFDVKADSQGAKSGVNYFIPANLPDITAIDFIKEICVFLGVTPVRVDDLGVIHTASIDNVLAGETETVDAIGIETVSPHFDNWAQKNYYKYKTNALQTNDFAAAIVSEDNTATASKDAFVSTFSALMGANEIPLFTSNGEMTAEQIAVSDNDVNNVLCVLDTAEDVATLTQIGLTWSTLLANYYSTKRDILRTPVITTVIARLTPKQTQQLDTAKCFYIPVLGAYYLPLQVETNGDTYKLKLIQLTNGAQPTPPPDPDVIVITDFEQYITPKFIVGAQWYANGAGNIGIVIPLGNAATVSLETPRYNAIEYAYLTSVDYDTPPKFATGYTEPVVAPAGQATETTRPANANYFYFRRYYDAGIIEPKNIKLFNY